MTISLFFLLFCRTITNNNFNVKCIRKITSCYTNYCGHIRTKVIFLQPTSWRGHVKWLSDILASTIYVHTVITHDINKDRTPSGRERGRGVVIMIEKKMKPKIGSFSKWTIGTQLLEENGTKKGPNHIDHCHPLHLHYMYPLFQYNFQLASSYPHETFTSNSMWLCFWSWTETGGCNITQPKFCYYIIVITSLMS